MRFLIVILFIFCAEILPAQNLLPNPSFEDTVQLSFGRTFAKDWISPNQSAPEHYNPNSRLDWRVPKSYAGYQFGHSGESYFGIKMYTLFDTRGIRSARDYIQCKIKNSLIKDSVYCFQAFVTLADSCNYASRNQLSLKFSNNPINSTSTANLNEVPDIFFSPTEYIDDKTNWLEFNFEYKALGGEQYLTIGNFNDTNNIDTVFVSMGGDRLNSDYNGTYYFFDDVYLGSCDSLPFDTAVGLREQNLIQRQHAIYPNPAATHFTLELEVKAQEQMVLNVYDLQGRIQVTQNLQPTRLHKIAIENLSQGVYFYRIQNEKGKMLSGKLMVE